MCAKFNEFVRTCFTYSIRAAVQLCGWLPVGRSVGGSESNLDGCFDLYMDAFTLHYAVNIVICVRRNCRRRRQMSDERTVCGADANAMHIAILSCDAGCIDWESGVTLGMWANDKTP